MKKTLLLGVLVLFCLSLSAEDHSSQYLNAIGVFSAQTIYLTYTSIEVLAERYDLGDFEDAEAVEEVDVYIKFAKQSSDELEKLQTSGALTGEDIAFANDMISGFYLLSSEANSLKSFINTQEQAHMDSFYAAKTQAWEKISKLLQLAGDSEK